MSKEGKKWLGVPFGLESGEDPEVVDDLGPHWERVVDVDELPARHGFFFDEL